MLLILLKYMQLVLTTNIELILKPLHGSNYPPLLPVLKYSTRNLVGFAVDKFKVNVYKQYWSNRLTVTVSGLGNLEITN